MHFLQSQYWREIKELLGNKTYLVDQIWFQTTKLPFLNKNIGYVPRVEVEDVNWNNLFQKGVEANCVYISLDFNNLYSENFISDLQSKNRNFLFKKGTPTHLQENAILNLQKSEEDILSGMKQKHRYNLKLAQKKGIQFKIEKSEEMFEEFLKLYKETADRQKYFGRSSNYLRGVWNYLKDKEMCTIATVYFEGEPLSSWFLFLFEDTIYYPYGGSSDKHKNLMATYLLVWEIIKWGKEHNYKFFDLWGIEKSGDDYDGFSRFKLGFGGDHIRHLDTVDLVINPNLYKVVKALSIFREKSKLLKKWL